MKSKQEALITKWAPVNILDIRRTETWLEHMAARGLIYQRQSSWNTLLGEFFCTVPHLFLAQFQKKEPQISRRYRLVPAPKNQRPSPEQLELYAHSGWQYVDFIDLFYASFLLFFSDDPGALEPYTDPDSFRLAYRFPVRGLAVVLLLFVGFDVLYQVLDFVGGGSASPDGLPALLTAWGGTICQILALLFALSVLVNFFLDLRAIRLIQQQIQQMQAARPTLPDRLFPAQKALTLASGALFLADLALSAVLIVLLVVQLPRTDVPLSKLETDFDLLTLEEMDGDNGWTPSRDLEAGRIHVRFNVADIYNHPSQQIEKQYYINQRGSGSSGRSIMETDYYLTEGPQAAQDLLDDLVQDLQSPENDRNSDFPNQPFFQTEIVPGSEEFLVRREGENWDVVALEGDRVLALRYSGALDLTEWYAEIAAMLTPNS